MKKIICICSATLLLLTGCATKDPCKDGHTWTDATCKAPKTCQVCSITEGVAVEHSYSEYTIITEPTCAKNGKEEAVCIWCEMKDQRELSKLEHSTEWEITTPATSNSEGLKSLKCQVCGEITSTEKIPKEPPKTTTQNNTNISNSSSHSKNNSIGVACDYVNSAKNDLSKAKKILTNVYTMCTTGTVDNSAFTYYNDAITLIKGTKTKLKSAYDIFSNNNSNHIFNTEVTYLNNVVPFMIDGILSQPKPNGSNLLGLSNSVKGLIDPINDILYEIIGRMIDMGY